MVIKLSKKVLKTLPVENKLFDLEGLETDHVEFHEGAHLVGYEYSHPDTKKFDIIFKTESTYTNSLNGGLVHQMTYKINEDAINFIWDEISGAIADYSGTYPIKITLAEIEINEEYEDQLALKSELSNYRQKDNLGYGENDQLTLKSELTDYTKNEQIINEENYTKTDITITGDKSAFTFNNDVTIDILNEKGFVFRAQADNNGKLMENYGGKFKLYDEYENKEWTFALEENNNYRIIITTTDNDTSKYVIKISTEDTFKANYHNRFDIKEWYFEDGINFDSNNVYCKELVDEKFALKNDLIQYYSKDELATVGIKDYKIDNTAKRFFSLVLENEQTITLTFTKQNDNYRGVNKFVNFS